MSKTSNNKLTLAIAVTYQLEHLLILTLRKRMFKFLMRKSQIISAREIY